MIVAVASWISLIMLAIAVLLGLFVVARADDDGSRAVVGDLAFFSALGMFVLVGVVKGSTAVMDAALLASIVGILATVALARILTRGQR